MGMVEKVAEAIRLAHDECPKGLPFTEYTEFMARAAILAMRAIPTETIFAASLRDPKLTRNPGIFWRGIIDAALAEKP